VEQRIGTHKENSKVLSEQGNAYTNVSEMAGKFSDLITAAREFFQIQSIPLALRQELIWPLIL